MIPARPKLGEKRATRGGFETLKHAQAALDKALKVRAQHATFIADMPTIAEYAELWASGLLLKASTIHGYRTIIRHQVTPQLGTVPLDKITATRLAAHYRELERYGRADGKGLSPKSVHKVHVLKVVQERLGHSTITTTMNIYSHVAPTMQKQAASRFAAFVQSGSSPASEAESGDERTAEHMDEHMKRK